MNRFIPFLALWGCFNPLFAQIDSSAQAEKWMQEAIIHYDGNRFERSLGLLNEAILVNNQPQLVDILYYYRALVWVNLSQKDKAIEDLNLAISSLNQTKPHYYALLGKLYFENNHFELAEANFKTSLSQKPQQAEPLTLWAAIALTEKNPTLGLERLNLAIQADKNYPNAYYYRGLVYFELLEPQLACQDWETAINLGFKELENSKKQFCR